MNENNYVLPALTLYIHIPFCQQKCPYCDFRSEVLQPWPEEEYVLAVQKELFWRRQQLAEDRRPLQAIFFGGGTPSLLAPRYIEALLSCVYSLWPVAEGCEITLEANPESAGLEKMRAWRQLGITRLSLGIQALDEQRLTWLQRPHNVATARQAIAHAQQVAFPAVSIDLIYATPEQTVAAWQRELDEAMGWGLQHLSCYTLTVEKGTPLYRGLQQALWAPVGEEREEQLFVQTRAQLAAGGWPGYEISNYAREGMRCRHNCNYWAYGDYLGVGTAAHGKWSRVDGGRERTQNPPTVAGYLAAMAGDPVQEAAHPFWQTQLLTAEEVGQEIILLGLRYSEGVNRALYRQVTGLDLLHRQSVPLSHWREAGWIAWDTERVYLTEAGLLRADALISRLC
ncbi:radical SAM family heme chaperone HemW [Candidatus Magnetaquicoccus inordinatus]|uniref:radical SAM family heme chaperone HemW n=1 Tax=Candidatus Magnetaquicoccus inordinatus TaxID=2496818 RepID=UPI00102B0C6E|nr:radical SAM family heme chaperone HemW [Candidatus Magnetaquicoccus inordinatus]